MRKPLYDLGLLIAVSAGIITITEMLMFGISIVTAIVLILSIAYIVVSKVKAADDKTMRTVTIGYLATICVTVILAFILGEKARPSVHVFEGAAVDTLAEEEFVVEDRDIPVQIETNDSLDTDSLFDIPADSILMNAEATANDSTSI